MSINKIPSQSTPEKSLKSPFNEAVSDTRRSLMAPLAGAMLLTSPACGDSFRQEGDVQYGEPGSAGTGAEQTGGTNGGVPIIDCLAPYDPFENGDATDFTFDSPNSYSLMLQTADGQTITHLNQDQFRRVTLEPGTKCPCSIAIVADESLILDANLKPITMLTERIDETYIDQISGGQNRHSASWLATSIIINRCFSSDVHEKPNGCPNDIPDTFYERWEPKYNVVSGTLPLDGIRQLVFAHITRPCTP